MTPVRNSLRTRMPEKASAVVLAFFMPKKPCAFGIYFKKGGIRMKRRTYRHLRKRMSKPAVRKQQIMRKEAKKLAKYPLKTAYIHPARLKQARKRGA